jgi:hypothetical protein
MNDEVPEEMRIACLEAMVAPFRDYYCQMSDNYSGSAFYMWWDHLRGCHKRETVLPVCQRVLKQILALPERGCQFAALHGLNHLHPDPAASEIVERYLDEHRPEMTPDNIKWVEMCRYGQAL